MSLHRTLSASCDTKGCPNEAILNPLDSQPWLTLIKMGWGVFHHAGLPEPALDCPDHKEN